MLENYHTHTTRCGHATGTDEEYVLQAIAGGLKVLGFSDHTPVNFINPNITRMRMYPENLEGYVSSVLSLKEKFADQIEIRLGLEAEYYPDHFSALLDLLAPYPISYLILGQHWCGNEINEPYNARPTEDVGLLARYCDQVIAGMETGVFSYVAHPDLLNFLGNPDLYKAHMTRLCQAAKAYGIPLELNFLGLRDGRHYPREDFWEIAGSIGCDVVFGSDAHRPQDVANPATEALALEIVQNYHLHLLEQVPIRPICR